MDFNPAGGRGDVLPVIVGAPTFDEGHPNRAHFGQIENRFVTLVHALGQQLGKHLRNTG